MDGTGRKLNVLIACEESGTVRDAFRELGHNAWSCDLQPCDPNSKYRFAHYQGDVLSILSATRLVGGVAGMQLPAKWDLVIAHPPCTYLCNSGVTWLFKNPDPTQFLTRLTPKGTVRRAANLIRYWNLHAAAEFFKAFLRLKDVPHVAIENPIMHGYAKELTCCGKPDQVVQPWMFGHPESKATCLWLKGLPKLAYNKAAAAVTKQYMMSLPNSQRQRLHWLGPSKLRAKLRSRTYKGIALAMATQWSDYILNGP